MFQRKNNFGSQLGEFFRSRSLLSGIIAANIAVWLFSLLFNIIDYLFCLRGGMAGGVWNEWFALASMPDGLLRRPWTAVTYMFLHAGLWHLLFNMAMLYVAGQMCCRYMGVRRFGWIYFLSGVFGGLLYVLFYNIFPVFYGTRSTLVGASAGVLGVFVAVATYMPNQEVYVWPFRSVCVRMKWLALIFVAVDLVSIPDANSGGHIAHIGGALFGFLFVWLSRGSLKEVTGRWGRSMDRARKERRQAHEARRRDKRYKAQARTRPVSDEQYNRKRADDQKRVDAILDKISKSGYDSLTKEEKTFLFTYKS